MPDLPDGWRWRAGRAGPDYWQAERLADSCITACGYDAAFCASNARMLDVAAPVRPRSHMPLMPAEGWPSDLLDAGFVQHPQVAHGLTLPGVHPGLSIIGSDRAHTIVQARLYLRAVAEQARERASRPERPARAARRAKAAQAAPAPPAPAPASARAEQIGMEL